MKKNFLRLLLCVSCSVLSSCASYQSLTLSHENQLKTKLTELKVDTASFHFPELASHVLNLQGELDMTDLAILAVLNNPELKLARDEAGISHAQAFAAGLLPDPQFNLTKDISNSAGTNGSKAFSYGLNFDVGALWTHSAMLSAATAEARKTDLNVLWQEWQLIAQTRLLSIKLIQSRKLLNLLTEHTKLFADRLNLAQSALNKKLLPNDVVLNHLSMLQDLQKQLHDVERQASQTQYELNALLGLSPKVELHFRIDFSLGDLDEKQVQTSLQNITSRRPDIMALEAAYQAQDERYRAALLGQFPSLNIGLTHAGDSSGVYSNGVGLTLSLPILNRNRGNIAIEQATRQKLHNEYEQRINIAHSDVEKILFDQHINQKQLQEVQMGVKKLVSAANQASKAFKNRNIDAVFYFNLVASLLAKRIEEINLQQAMLEQRISLQTLIGGDLPIHSLTESQIP